MTTDTPPFDVIVIGGSYAGLAAGMTLGRSLRYVLIIDSGKPCNAQTPHSHNFITHDGTAPAEIASLARDQVMKYPTVKFVHGLVTDAKQTDSGFVVKTRDNQKFSAKKLLFATGFYDEMPAIEGFADCWGVSVLHCPYCHGYEVRGEKLGIIGNGDLGFELCKLINHWSKNLILLTNGTSTLSNEQLSSLKAHNIGIDERTIKRINHINGKLSSIEFEDKSKTAFEAVYARPGLKQHCDIPEQMGCELTEHGFIRTNDFLQTTVAGVYAAGDNTTMLRSVSNAAASGHRAGAFINKELIDEAFERNS